LHAAAANLRCGDQVVVTGSLVSSKYECEVSQGKKPTTLKLTSWQIRASTLRKLNRAGKEPEAAASGPSREATAAPCKSGLRKGPMRSPWALFASATLIYSPADGGVPPSP
jgi:single-stranded DNA-binding protein